MAYTPHGKCNNYTNCSLADADQLIEVMDWTTPPPRCPECDKNLKPTEDLRKPRNPIIRAIIILSVIVFLTGLSVYVNQNYKKAISSQQTTEEKKEADVKAEEEQLQRKQEQEAQVQREAQLAEVRVRMINDEVVKYRTMIHDQIRSRVVRPPGLSGHPVAEVTVGLLETTGGIAYVRVTKTSGYSSYDRAIEKAIRLSAPFTLPDDHEVSKELTKIHLKMHYHEKSP